MKRAAIWRNGSYEVGEFFGCGLENDPVVVEDAKV